ncbi:MAG TPA: aspartate aminotransferase family protein, partial [Burkholderiaceae bacterium]|nr:aspartate aminotransferase family protein [Burkholderiaceae bacterium]
MNPLLHDAALRASRYLEGLDDRPVQPRADAVARLGELDGQPLPEQPQSADAVLRQLDELGSPATMANAGGRFFGFVVGG